MGEVEKLNGGETELETRIRQRIAQLREALDKFVVTANQQVMAYNTAIAELQRLMGEGPLVGQDGAAQPPGEAEP